VVISVLTLFLERTGWASGFEMAALDGVVLAGRALEPENVVIVAITEQDYAAADLFDETSPLDPRVVHEVIDAIVAGGPRAIGVDLDTSSRKFRTFAPSRHWPPIVWACNAEPVPGTHLFDVGEVLGGQDLDPPPVRGVALLPASFDSVLREYRRWFHTIPAGARHASFPRAVAELANPRLAAHDEADGEDLILNSLTSPASVPRIAVRDVLSASAGEGWKDGPLDGKVVILGGTYRAGRDRHRTPGGERDGVELMAQAVELELQGAGIHHVGHIRMFFAELFAGMILAWIGHRYSPIGNLFLSLGAVPVLGVLCSVVVFASLSLWANFALPLVGVVLHQMYELARECAHDPAR